MQLLILNGQWLVHTTRTRRSRGVCHLEPIDVNHSWREATPPTTKRDSDETNSTETEATAKVDFYEMIVSGNEQFNNCFIAHRRHCFTDNYAISQRTVTEEKL